MSVTHKIHRQILELNVAVNKDTYALQTQFRELYYADLLPLIEAEMDRLAPGDEVIVIDRLELDLGKVIHNSSLDQTIKERLAKALEEQFFPIRFAHEEGNTKGSFRLQSTGDVAEWKTESKMLTNFEAFIFFLETGAIPWGTTVQSRGENAPNNASRIDATSRINALIEEIVEEKFHELVEYIKRNVGYTRVQQRIYHHFNLEQLRKLVLRAVAQDLGLTTVQLLELQKELLTIAGVTISNTSRQEKAIWWSLFLIVAGIKTEAIRLNSILPLFITLIKQEFGNAQLSIRNFFSFIEEQPQNAKQIIELFAKMGVDVPATLKKIRSLAKKVAENPTANPDAEQTLSRVLEMRQNVFQLHKILPIIDNDWFLEWNEIIQSEEKKKVDETTIEVFAIRKETKNEENSASKVIEEAGISVENAGLVLLAYFLPHLFDHLGWIENKQIREESLPKALSMTQFLATGEEIVDESALVLNKLLLGIDLDDPMTNDYQLSDLEKELGIDLLKNVITRWEALRSVSVAGFQQTFLKREGIVYFRDNQYLLRVEKKTVDILMEKIPWSIGVIKLSWMPKMMITEW